MAGKWICPVREECLAEDGSDDCDHAVQHGVKHNCLSVEDSGGDYYDYYNESRCPDCVPINKWAKAQLLRWKVEGKV